MPEDNTPMTPTMPPVDDTQGYSAPTTDAPVVDETPMNPAAQAAPMVTPPATEVDDDLATVMDNSPIVTPDVEIPSNVTDEKAAVEQNKNIYTELIGKIRAAKNILIALSSNPSVDEMAAAIGLSLYLDKLGKRATAIYSGVTPNALEFLKPEETFEPTADALQDFVIALNKEKADHLRYKLDGEFVKIYITPYKTRIADSDLEFSYGDFNVDLVLALDVANGIDLDSALREHGRIMHDAVIVNISTSKPGKFGEIEWSDKTASSVSEMIARLLYEAEGDIKIGKEEATAFLTGIVAATNRFSNAGTTPETMQTASKLMRSGANQQLVSKNITPDVENEMVTLYSGGNAGGKHGDPTNLDIDHDGDRNVANSEKEVDADIADKESTLLDDLKAAEASLAQAGAEAVDEPTNEPMKISTTDEGADLAEPQEGPKMLDSDVEQNLEGEPEGVVAAHEPVVVEPTSEPEIAATPEPMIGGEDGDLGKAEEEKVVQPEADFNPDEQDEFEGDKYGHMLEDALGNVGESNPAVASAPSVPSAPEINGVPEMNYAAPASDDILPPPPAPPVDMTSGMPLPQENFQPADGQATAVLPEVQPIEVAAPPVEPTLTSLGAQPAMQDQVYGAQAADPGAFKIPGM